MNVDFGALHTRIIERKVLAVQAITRSTARDSRSGATWYANEDDLIGGYCIGLVAGPASEMNKNNYIGNFLGKGQAELIADRDPATIIRECDADLALVRDLGDAYSWDGMDLTEGDSWTSLCLTNLLARYPEKEKS
jgi:hypothetical protein